MSLADEIQKLQSLRQSGALSDAEFEAAKARLLGAGAGPPPVPPALPLAPAVPSAPSEESARQWAMFLHLSVLAGYVLPVAGLVAPVVIWQMKKKEMPWIDAHGCNAVNWIITFVIAFVVCIPLFLVLIGFPLMIALGVVGIIFPVVAAVKANNGELWRYPVSFTFFRPEKTEERSW
jgi:uncharacterized Tic20 family protein